MGGIETDLLKYCSEAKIILINTCYFNHNLSMAMQPTLITSCESIFHIFRYQLDLRLKTLMHSAEIFCAAEMFSFESMEK